jgi:hypothetical protein
LYTILARSVTFRIRLRYVTLRFRKGRLIVATRSKHIPMNFRGMPQADVPLGRNGKHKEIVSRIISDLDQVPKGVALKVPLTELTATKEQVRSALNRATRKSGRTVATATDGKFLYVWNEIR